MSSQPRISAGLLVYRHVEGALEVLLVHPGGHLPDKFELRSNDFELEWPPRSGRTRSFPEIDRAEFFAVDLAREKINLAQGELLDRLMKRLRSMS